MTTKRIVITGGPGTGKTSVIKQLEQSGYHCFHEIIRSMTLKAKEEENSETFVSNPLAFVSDPLEFNKKLLLGRLEQHKEGNNTKQEIIFYDRGIPDVLAYMDYFKQEYKEDFKSICINNRYDHIFILPPWKEIYISDNERLENFEEAVQIDKHLEQTYKSLGYNTTIVPIGSVADRTQFILEKI